MTGLDPSVLLSLLEPLVELLGPREARIAAAEKAIETHLGLRPPEPTTALERG